MARIRSVHPGLFMDEAFIELTHSARLFLIGLWTECDDNGIFEWKPIVLRMRLFAGDSGGVDIKGWLDETMKHNIVMRFEFDGKTFGAVRNFRKWQRPKKPNCKYPLPPEAESFVGDPDVREDSAERGLALGKMLCEQQDHHCFYCSTEITYHRKKSNSLQVDHKTPISRGGKDDIGNLVAACKPCNALKANMTEREFKAKFAPSELRVRHGYENTGSVSVGNQSGVAATEGGGRRKEEWGKGKPQNKTSKTERESPPIVAEAPPAAPSGSLSEVTNRIVKEVAAKSPVSSHLANAIGTNLPGDWTPDDDLCAQVSADFGMVHADINAELIAFHAHHAAEGSYSANWRASFVTWCKRWKEHRDKQVKPRVEVSNTKPKQTSEFTDADWDQNLGFYARTGRWSSGLGPDPMSPSCKAPRHLWEKHGINDQGERRIPPRKPVEPQGAQA